MMRFALITVGLLLIPLIAMQFTNEVHWTLSDFIFAGTLFFGSGFAYEQISKRLNTRDYRLATGIAILAVVLLIWINAAVGILGSENNPIKLLYFLVPAVGIIGLVFSRLKPRKLSQTLFAMASVQVLIPLVALLAKPHILSEPPGPLGAIALNTFFALLFIISAILFMRAGEKNNSKNFNEEKLLI